MNRARRLVAAASTGLIVLAATACGTTDTDTAEPEGTAGATPASQSCAEDTTTTSTGPVSFTDGVGRQVELDKPAQPSPSSNGSRSRTR